MEDFGGGSSLSGDPMWMLFAVTDCNFSNVFKIKNSTKLFSQTKPHTKELNNGQLEVRVPRIYTPLQIRSGGPMFYTFCILCNCWIFTGHISKQKGAGCSCEPQSMCAHSHQPSSCAPSGRLQVWAQSEDSSRCVDCFPP